MKRTIFIYITPKMAFINLWSSKQVNFLIVDQVNCIWNIVQYWESSLFAQVLSKKISTKYLHAMG